MLQEERGSREPSIAVLKYTPHGAWGTTDVLMQQISIWRIIHTVNLRSKGPARKGNPPLRDTDLSLNKFFFCYSYIGYKGISVKI